MKIIKKICLALKRIVLGIINFVDRFIIVPVTKLILMFTEKSNKNGMKFEQFLMKKNTLTFISLILAILFFFLVDSKSIVLIETNAEVLYNQKVEAIYNSEAYVVEGLPKEADVVLIGRKVDLFLAKQLSNKAITVDISDLGVGTHKVNLTYENAITSIDYKVDPSTANITIYPKLSETRTVNVDVLNQDKIDSKLSISNVSIDDKDIIIKGAEHVLEKVSTVKALVDVSNIIEPSVGISTLKNVPLVAYDNKGNVVDVEMVPSEVTATISIISPSKELPIKIIPSGNVEFGKAISSISTSVTKVTVYGDEDIINNLQFIPITVDVSGMSSSKEFNVLLTKPSGIRYISESSTVVKISLDTEVTTEVSGIQIEYNNLDSNYKATAISRNDVETSVILKGTKSVLDNLDTSTIKATVDLSGLGIGDHEVDVVVSGDEVKVNYTPKTTKIKIRISKK